MYTETEVDDYVLTAEDLANLEALGDFVEDEPEIVDATLRKYGIQPSEDPGLKALQLIEIGESSVDFDADLASEAEVLGFQFKLPKINFKGMGKIFKKKGGGGKIGNFFKGLFRGKKRSLRDAIAKLEAGQDISSLTKKERRVYERSVSKGEAPRFLSAAVAAAQAASEEMARTSLAEADKTKTVEEEKKKKMEQNYMIAGAIIIVIIIGLVMWNMRKKK